MRGGIIVARVCVHVCVFAEVLEAGVGGRCSRDDERCARLRRCAESRCALVNAQSPAMQTAPRTHVGAATERK